MHLVCIMHHHKHLSCISLWILPMTAQVRRSHISISELRKLRQRVGKSRLRTLGQCGSDPAALPLPRAVDSLYLSSPHHLAQIPCLTLPHVTVLQLQEPSQPFLFQAQHPIASTCLTRWRTFMPSNTQASSSFGFKLVPKRSSPNMDSDSPELQNHCLTLGK